MLLVLALLLLTALPAAAGEFDVEYGLTLSEEYNDNVFLAPRGEVDDYITRARPSVHLVYEAPVWQWDFAYTYDYRYYAQQSRDDDSAHTLSLSNRTHLVRDFLFLNLRDDYRRVSLDTTRDYTVQSLFLNQTDTNDLIVSPYTVFNLTSQTSGTAGYEYRNVWYKETAARSKNEHALFADLSDQLSVRTALTGGARLSREDSETLTYEKAEIYAGPRYEYAEDSFLWLFLGSSWFWSDEWKNEQQGFWDVGIAHKFVTYSLSFNAALTYIDDPIRVRRREDRYVATFRKETDRIRLEAIAGRWEYRDILTKRLQNTRHGLQGSVGYDFTQALRGTYSLRIDRYEDNRARTSSMVYINQLRGEYLFPANTVLALDYRFDHGYSPDAVNYGMNYDNNRVVLEIRKTF